MSQLQIDVWCIYRECIIPNKYFPVGYKFLIRTGALVKYITLLLLFYTFLSGFGHASEIV